MHSNILDYIYIFKKLINNSGGKHKEKRVVSLYVIKNHVNLHKL